jgi:hypothetical protein
MRNTYIFEDMSLPAEFRFPKAYIKLVQEGFPDLKPWWFVAEEPETAKMLYQIINEELKSKKLLIPFAKIDDSSGDVACFDGEDTSGNPKVYFSVGAESDMSKIDWHERYFLESFDVWLESAKKEAEQSIEE